MLNKHATHFIRQAKPKQFGSFRLVVTHRKQKCTTDQDADYIPLNIKLSVLQKLLQCHALVAEDFCCEKTEDHQRIRKLLLDCLYNDCLLANSSSS